MAIITLAEMKAQLAFTDDLGAVDDELISGKIDAAQSHIERLLGFKIEATYGGVDQDPVPSDLKEAVFQLAAWWYDNREAVGASASELPFGVSSIVNEYRGFTF